MQQEAYICIPMVSHFFFSLCHLAEASAREANQVTGRQLLQQRCHHPHRLR